MSESAGNYTIKIKTEKEGDALEKTAADLKDVGKHAQTGAEGMKLFGRNTHEVHAALRVLNEAIPGFEMLARFLSNRLTLLMGMGGAAIAYVKGKCDDLNKALDDLNASPGARGEWAEKLEKQALDSAVAFNVWKDSIDRIVKAHETLQQLTDRSIAADRERITTQKAIGDAQRQLDEARLQLAEKLGQVTPEQAIKIRLEIDDAAFKRDLEAKAAEIQAEIGQRTQEVNKNNLLFPQKEKAVVDTQIAADDAAEAKTKNDEKLAQDKKNLEESRERQKKAQEIVDAMNSDPATRRGMAEMAGLGLSGIDPDTQKYNAAQKAVEEESRRQGSLRRAIGQEQGKQPDLDTAAETTKADAADAKAKYEAAVKLDQESRQKIADLKNDLARERAKNTALENLHNQTSAAQAHSQQINDAHNAVTQANEVAKRALDAQALLEMGQPNAANNFTPGPAAYVITGANSFYGFFMVSDFQKGLLALEDELRRTGLIDHAEIGWLCPDELIWRRFHPKNDASPFTAKILADADTRIVNTKLLQMWAWLCQLIPASRPPP